MACGVRDLQLRHEQITVGQFYALLEKVDMLQQTVNRQEKQLKNCGIFQEGSVVTDESEQKE